MSASDPTATAVVLLHAAPEERVQAWYARVHEAAAAMPGFVALRLARTGVTAMTYGLMPFATRRFSRWLDPVAGATVRVSVVGALVVFAMYAVWLTLFATVPWLQHR